MILVYKLMETTALERILLLGSVILPDLDNCPTYVSSL